MRKLASIQEITSISPIPGADSIEVANVLGWHVVVKKGEFEPRERIVYVEVDSVLPEKPEYEFLRKYCYIDKNGFKGFRIRTAKLMGQVSQGIVFPLSVLPKQPIGTYYSEQDVTDLLGIVKYDPPTPATLSGLVKGNFPAFIPKTDETRIQAIPGILERHRGKECYATEKLDGSSMTAYLYGDQFGICSRNLELKESENNALWQVATRYDLKGAIEGMGGNLALQGEIIGPGVQGNKYKLKETQFRIYNIYDLEANRYIDYLRAVGMINGLDYDVPLLVPLIDYLTLDHSVDQIVELSRGKSQLADIRREGIVVRPVREATDPQLGRLSFKAINPDFLLKWGE
ncbi:RNA ligase (ATP) [Candidatus Pacearchaeota archaeon]|jgi:RNA ligase (TIGR02306 family)|nr:RNA ligase (ATP) [Candidatus Pacearchaeota archaeon]